MEVLAEMEAGMEPVRILFCAYKYVSEVMAEKISGIVPAILLSWR